MITLSIILIILGLLVLTVTLFSGMVAIIWSIAPFIIVAFILYKVFTRKKNKGGDK